MTRMHVGAVVFGLMSSAWAFCAPEISRHRKNPRNES